METKKEYRHITRIANTDLAGAQNLLQGLSKIKGVGFMFANAICSVMKIDKGKKIGDLSDEEVKKIGELLKDPLRFKIPVWMLNRRKDVETGVDTHLLSSDLDFVQDNDIKMMKKIKSYRGVRHMLGLPVRGQRTRSNFRKNKGKVQGVKKRGGAKAGRV